MRTVKIRTFLNVIKTGNVDKLFAIAKSNSLDGLLINIFKVETTYTALPSRFQVVKD